MKFTFRASYVFASLLLAPLATVDAEDLGIEESFPTPVDHLNEGVETIFAHVVCDGALHQVGDSLERLEKRSAVSAKNWDEQSKRALPFWEVAAQKYGKYSVPEDIALTKARSALAWETRLASTGKVVRRIEFVGWVGIAMEAWMWHRELQREKSRYPNLSSPLGTKLSRLYPDKD
jgi:hypothetical protein